MAEVQKQADQAEQTSITRTAEAVREGGVIAGQKNQDVHGEAFEQAHKDDRTLSEPDMIAMNDGETVAQYKARVAQIQANRFGFFDSAEEKKNDTGVAGKTKIHEHPAKQAIEALPSLSPTIQQPPFDSSVKANVQITNVPEVSDAVQQEVLGKYAGAVLENAAAAVREIENHLAQPNAINSDFQQIGQWLSEGPGHFAQSPEQLNKDVQGIVDTATAQIDKPLEPEERAKMAGMLLPMFFFEGGKEPINPETIEQMGLEGMSEAELKALGIEKRIEVVEEEIAGKRRVLEKKDIVNPIDRDASVFEKLAQLETLSQENKPLVERFLKQIDTKLGTSSEVHFKESKEILGKAKRPDVKAEKPWFEIEHVRDSFRFKTPLENLNDLPKIVEALKASEFEVIKLDLDKLLNPKGRGWRVAVVDLKAPNGQIVEYQILPREMNEAGRLEHPTYRTWRNSDVTALTGKEKILKERADAAAIDIYSDAWDSYLERTGQTEQNVKEIVKQAYEQLGL